MERYVIQLNELDLSLRQQGFHILSGSGEFVSEVKTGNSGSLWYELKAINSDAVVIAQSLLGDDLTAGGTYALSGSATPVTITKNTSIMGRFSKVRITSGAILAYKG